MVLRRGGNRRQPGHPDEMASTVLNQMPQSSRARRQALLLIALMASVSQALNARLCVGANPYIGSWRVFDERQALAGRPGSDLSTRERRHPLVPVGPPRTLVLSRSFEPFVGRRGLRRVRPVAVFRARRTNYSGHVAGR